jgi:hypothetical protein
MRFLLIATVAALAGQLAASRPAGAGEGVRVIWSFERDETAKQLPQFGYWGKPVDFKSPKAGWRGEKVGPDWKDDVTAIRKASSRDYPLMTLVARHVTHGQHAYVFEITEKESAGWASRIKKQSSITACPPKHDYHDIEDWYYQRCNWHYLWRSQPANRDWSGFDRLRFDVYCEGSEVVLGVKVRDLTKKGRQPLGVRTPALLFKVPAGKAVTCDVPLADAARVCELDLSTIHRYHVRINSMLGGLKLYMDNVRLVKKSAAKDDAKLPLIALEGEPQAWGRPVVFDGHSDPDPDELKRRAGSVEKLGPVLITEAAGQYASLPSGHFGGTGVTYGQSARRGCVAYDKDRLLVIIGGGPEDAKLVTKSVGEGGGVYAFASFDGGKTWGGLERGDPQPWRLGNWYWRGNLYSDDRAVYWMGTQNCDSYHEGFDMLFRRVALTGRGWSADRVACVAQNGYKCPGWGSAVRTRSGRLWAAWHDGFGGEYAKCSDDDGYTWRPCKDASIEKLPRPFYEPKLEDLAKPAAQRPEPPEKVLLWPADVVCGDFLVPYRQDVAVFSIRGDQWQVHDGKKWGAVQKGPFASKDKTYLSCTVIGTDHVFISRREGGKLYAAHHSGGQWHKDELDGGTISADILTASGEAVFCFYVRKSGEGYEIRYRRWKGGEWEPSVKLHTEQVQLNTVAAPLISPPDYAAVFWDQSRPGGKRAKSFVKFMRVPNE